MTQPATNSETAVISLGVTDGIQEQLDGFEWDFTGYEFCSVTGSLRDIKKAVALLSAGLDPQLSTLETIRIAHDKESDSIHLVMVLTETFEELQDRLEAILRETAKHPFQMERANHRIIPVQELPENGDLIIPVETIEYLTEPLVFDRLSIDTEDESFLHTF